MQNGISLSSAGVDEAGRGALAGPVVAAAVILDLALPSEIFKDSKVLSARKREILFEKLCNSKSVIGVGFVSEGRIDQINILQATMKAMTKAIWNLRQKPDEVLIDGNRCPDLPGYSLRAIVDGDAKVPCISAASIVAKVLRDRFMKRLGLRYPNYHLAINKGYGTKAHREAIFLHGKSPVHRRTFRAVFP